jgi:hypothetical protein
MLPRIYEYPDPPIAAYLARVRGLSDAEWEALAPRLGPAPAGAPRRTRALLVALDLLARAAGWAVVGMTLWGSGAPRAARRAYRRLFADLRRARRPVFALQRVGSGLRALQQRDFIPAHAPRLYDLSVGAIIPREALGWAAAPDADGAGPQLSNRDDG